MLLHVYYIFAVFLLQKTICFMYYVVFEEILFEIFTSCFVFRALGFSANLKAALARQEGL